MKCAYQTNATWKPVMAGCALAVLVFFMGSSGIAAPQYTVTRLGPGYGYGINDLGEVAGKSYNLSYYGPAIWRYGIPTLLPASTSGMAMDVNNAGVVAGSDYGCPSLQSAPCGMVWYPPYGPSDRYPLPGLGVSPGGLVAPVGVQSINNGGQVVGHSPSGWSHADDWYGPYHAASWDGSGIVTDIGVLAGETDSYGYGINDAGKVVGMSGTKVMYWGGVGNTPVHIDTPLFQIGANSAYDINNAKQMVGSYTYNTSPYLYEAYRYDHNPPFTLTPLGLLPGQQRSTGYGINDAGEVVGVSDYPAFPRAFVWNDWDGMVQLDQAIFPLDPLDGLVMIESAKAINNLGWILARGIITGESNYQILILKPFEVSSAYLTAGSPVSISQTVNTPDTAFDMKFDYRFDTATGTLTVRLDGSDLVSIPAPGTLQEDFQTVTVAVSGTHLDKAGVVLEFELDGTAGSAAALDNIIFPGVINSRFASGDLTGWTADTSSGGSVGAEDMTVPADLTMAADPPLGGTVLPASGPVDAGEAISISASAAAGYRFDGWSASPPWNAAISDDSAAAATVTLTGDATVTASFVGQWNLTMAVDPVGGGTTIPAAGGSPYGVDDGATTDISVAPSAGYIFTGWTADPPANAIIDNEFAASTTVTLIGDATVTAHVVRQWELTMAVDPAEGGATTPTAGGSPYTYEEGEEIGITAVPNGGYGFVNWTANPLENALFGDEGLESTTVVLSGDATVTAHFTPQWELTMTSSPAAGGTTTPPAGPHTVDGGVQTALAAMPSEGYLFSGWSANPAVNADFGDVFAASTTVALSGDTTVTAHFHDPLVFFDDFSLGTWRGAPSWTNVAGRWRCSKRKRYYPSTRKNNITVVSDPALASYSEGVLGTIFKFPKNAVNKSSIAVIFAYQDKANYRYFRMMKKGRRVRFTIGQKGDYGGEAAGVKDSLLKRFKLTRWNQVRIELHQGGLTEVFLNGQSTPKVSATFIGAPPGQVGYHGSKVKVLCDDFTAWDETALP